MKTTISLLILGLALGGELDDPQFRFHFHEVGRRFGSPMGAVYNPNDELFHLYFATPLDVPVRGLPDAVIDGVDVGAVGYATSADLVSWDEQWPVLQPDEGCLIDGGSVVMRANQFTMFYGQRCCSSDVADVTACPTEIRRATATHGAHWTKGGGALLTFKEAPHWTLPSVVFDAESNRWVMALSYTVAQLFPSNTGPMFYHSVDGIVWTQGGLFDAPDLARSPAVCVWNARTYEFHFRSFRNNFLVPLGDASAGWILTGTRHQFQEGDTLPVWYFGNLSESESVFVTADEHAHPMMFDRADSPFPVWGHPDHELVTMSVIQKPYLYKDTPVDYRPLSLPVHYERDGSTLRSEWLPAVRSLAVADTRTNMGVSGEAQKVEPLRLSPHGVYYFSGWLDSGGSLPHFFLKVGRERYLWAEAGQTPWNGSPLVTNPDIVLNLVGSGEFCFMPTTSYRFEVLIDKGVQELLVGATSNERDRDGSQGGYLSRVPFQCFTPTIEGSRPCGPVDLPDEFEVHTQHGTRLLDGWTFAPMNSATFRPRPDKPPDPTPSGDPTPPPPGEETTTQQVTSQTGTDGEAPSGARAKFYVATVILAYIAALL